MKRNNTNRPPVVKYIIIAIALFAIALFASCISALLMREIRFSDDQVGIVATLSSGVIAAIASGLVLFELKAAEQERFRQNDIEEASFLLEYNQSFIQDENMTEVESLLEDQAYYGRTDPIITSETRQLFVNYLVYLEGLAPLIMRGILTLEHIDDLMAYRFFLAVNNPEVQEKELKKFPGDYRGCFKLYRMWSKYRRDKGYEIHLEETALDKWEVFSKYASQ